MIVGSGSKSEKSLLHTRHRCNIVPIVFIYNMHNDCFIVVVVVVVAFLVLFSL